MLYIQKFDAADNAVALDDMILTTDSTTTAGSKMLANYTSLFEAEVVTKLKAAGYAIAGKANVGEFGLDLMGETSHFGPVEADGKLVGAPAAILASEPVKAVVCFDVNGAPRRMAALSDALFVKPTYGTVSRYGTIPAACSGETVGVMARNADDAAEILAAIMGHDDKDGTSLPAEKCKLGEAAPVKKIAVVGDLTAGTDADMAAKVDAAKASLAASGIEVAEIDCSVMAAAKTAWGILMSAELCNNVSRYDGVKFGHRTENYTNIDELYTNSRTEAFGMLTKTTILYGSETLSTENYMKVYDKAMRVRRVIVEAFADIFAEFDAVLVPAASKCALTADDDAFDEAFYTAPASITGLPAVAAKGVQLVGRAFSEATLLSLAKVL